ncbi:MAG: hypothetical protein RIT81_18465 [Deltaproteobacteria bacterium]
MNPYSAPVTDSRASAPDGPVEMSAAWAFGLPKLKRVFYFIAATYGLSMLLSFLGNPPTIVIVAALIFQGGLALVHVGLAALAGKKPIVATWIAIALFVVFQVIPTFLVPSSIFLGVFVKGLTLMLLIFAYRTAKELAAHPKWVAEDL